MPTTAPAASRHRKPSSSRRDDEAPLIPILARKVREVEAKAQRGKLGPTNRVKFQVIAFLVREERARVKADTEIGDGPARSSSSVSTGRDDPRQDGRARHIAHPAPRGRPGHLARRAGACGATGSSNRAPSFPPDELIITDVAPTAAPVVPAAVAARQVVPVAIEARQLSNPFLAPDLTPRAAGDAPRRRLDGWELMGPLYKAFESGAGGGAATMDLPPVPEFDRVSPKGLDVMPHQSRFLEAVREGHRTFLLADEPGSAKTAESVLAASVAGAYRFSRSSPTSSR